MQLNALSLMLAVVNKNYSREIAMVTLKPTNNAKLPEKREAYCFYFGRNTCDLGHLIKSVQLATVYDGKYYQNETIEKEAIPLTMGVLPKKRINVDIYFKDAHQMLKAVASDELIKAHIDMFGVKPQFIRAEVSPKGDTYFRAGYRMGEFTSEYICGVVPRQQLFELFEKLNLDPTLVQQWISTYSCLPEDQILKHA